jgi:uroporphyrinogen decarboxylase
VDYAPIWLMRQAGRALPEYRKLKERHSFLELVRTPELATEVTLQPIRRFGMDAAILFSDILIVPEAMGQGYHFRETGGVEMEFTLRTAADIERLSVEAIRERLEYVSQAIRQIKPELEGRTALIGFAGSPWTLANFMLEGGSAKAPKAALALLQNEPEVFQTLMRKLTRAVIELLQMQITAGVDAIQIFDSHGGLLPRNLFRAGSGLWIARIVQALRREVPVIVFSKGTRVWQELVESGANVLGIDHGVQMKEVLPLLPDFVAAQGNLDPGLLVGEPELARLETLRLVSEINGRPGWILNLGHGLPPTANLDCISAVIEALRNH